MICSFEFSQICRLSEGLSEILFLYISEFSSDVALGEKSKANNSGIIQPPLNVLSVLHLSF